MKALKFLFILVLLTFVIGFLPAITIAGGTPPTIPPPLPTPTPVPPSGGGSSGGGGSSSGGGSTFQPYTMPVVSSEGVNVGTITGIDYFTARLIATSNASINGENFSLVIEEDLDYSPVGPIMDIKFLENGSLPKGMNDVDTLAVVSINVQSKMGWPVKSGTQKLTFDIPLSKLDKAGTYAYFYLVLFDGKGYHIVTPELINRNGSATFVASPGADSGTFTLLMAHDPEPVIVPCPTPITNASAKPTANPDNPFGLMGVNNYLIWILLLITGIVMGAVAMLTLVNLWR
jgi:hypothetical protein